MVRKDAQPLIKKWAKDIGMEIRDIADPRTDFRLVVNEPNLPAVDVVHQGVEDAYVILASSVLIPEVHRKKLLELNKKVRDEFLWEIRFRLLSMDIEFRLDEADGLPTVWRIFARVYLERTSIQDFWKSYLSVKNASFLVSWMLQRLLEEPIQKIEARAFPETIVDVAWNRAGAKCERCGKPLSWASRGKEDQWGAWEVHHIRSVSEGGTDTPSNIEILCSNCHKATHIDGQ